MCFSTTVDKDLKDSNPFKKIKKKLWRIRNCAIAWFLISVVIFIIGIILLVYYADKISTDHWQRGVGIAGIVFLLAGLLGLAIGITLFVVFCMVFKRQQARMEGRPMHMSDVHKKQFPPGTYPRQPDFVPPGQGSAQPGAPVVAPQPSAPAADGGSDNPAVDPEEIVITPTEKF